MGEGLTPGRDDDAVGQASVIAMERYELTEARAVALLARIARRRKVELQVVAAAVIAAAVARRMR
jgi:AmiR/NasT family two-component response regulator